MTTSTSTSTVVLRALPLMLQRQPPWVDAESCCEDGLTYKILGSSSKKGWVAQGSALDAYASIKDKIVGCLRARESDLYDSLDLSFIPHAFSCFMVGTTKQKSRPRIVIFSPLQQFCKRIKGIVEQTQWWTEFKQLHPAWGDFLLQPCRPRQIGHGIQDWDGQDGPTTVYTKLNAWSPLGAQLFFTDVMPNQFVPHNATLGNLIFLDGVPYALTVAHAVRHMTHVKEEQGIAWSEFQLDWLPDSEDDVSDDDPDDSTASVNSTFSANSSASEQHAPLASTTVEGTTSKPTAQNRPLRLGVISASSGGSANDSLDCALIATTTSIINTLFPPTSPTRRSAGFYQHSDGTRLIVPCPTFIADAPSSAVKVFTTGCDGRLVRGALSATTSLVCLYGSRDYMSLQTVTLEERLQPGDCGKWIFDKEGHWYGHIIAGLSDSNIAYMASATSIVAAIEAWHGSSVSLTNADISRANSTSSAFEPGISLPTPRWSDWAEPSHSYTGRRLLPERLPPHFDLASKSSMDQKSSLHPLLRDFLLPSLRDYMGCLRYCTQNPAIWFQDAGGLRDLAVTYLQEGEHQEAERCAERWLMANIAHSWESNAVQANSFFRALNRNDDDFRDKLAVLMKDLDARAASEVIEVLSRANQSIVPSITDDEIQPVRNKDLQPLVINNVLQQIRRPPPSFSKTAMTTESTTTNDTDATSSQIRTHHIDANHTTEKSLYGHKVRAEDFFTIGKVLDVPCPKPAGTGSPPMTSIYRDDASLLTLRNRNETVSVGHTQPMVVVRRESRPGHFTAIPINTYRSSELPKNTLPVSERQAQTVTYASEERTKGMPGETSLDTELIQVDMASGEKLAPRSRIYFGSIHHIRFVEEVKHIGDINDQYSINLLMEHFAAEIRKRDGDVSDGELHGTGAQFDYGGDFTEPQNDRQETAYELPRPSALGQLSPMAQYTSQRQPHQLRPTTAPFLAGSLFDASDYYPYFSQPSQNVYGQLKAPGRANISQGNIVDLHSLLEMYADREISATQSMRSSRYVLRSPGGPDSDHDDDDDDDDNNEHKQETGIERKLEVYRNVHAAPKAPDQSQSRPDMKSQ